MFLYLSEVIFVLAVPLHFGEPEFYTTYQSCSHCTLSQLGVLLHIWYQEWDPSLSDIPARPLSFMTTRSGTSFKKMESVMTTEAQEGAEAVSITCKMKLMLEEHQRQQEQIDWLMQLVERSHTRTEGRGLSTGTDKVKLMKFTEQDDIEAYITTFEKLMVVYENFHSHWAYKLAPGITEKAQQASYISNISYHCTKKR